MIIRRLLRAHAISVRTAIHATVLTWVAATVSAELLVVPAVLALILLLLVWTGVIRMTVPVSALTATVSTLLLVAARLMGRVLRLVCVRSGLLLATQERIWGVVARAGGVSKA